MVFGLSNEHWNKNFLPIHVRQGLKINPDADRTVTDSLNLLAPYFWKERKDTTKRLCNHTRSMYFVVSFLVVWKPYDFCFVFSTLGCVPSIDGRG